MTTTCDIIKIEVTENNKSEVSFPDEFLLGIYDVVKFTKELCERENIEYFIDGGTLLGCVREEGQILWDNDADFGISPPNFKKLKQFKSDFEKQGYRWKDNEPDKIQVQNLNMWFTQNNTNICPCLDILVYKTIKENFISKVVISNETYRRQYPYATYYQKHLYPLVNYTYRCLDAEPLVLKGANNPKKYLDGSYPNWKEKLIYDHKIYYNAKKEA
jgi:phosphorylcholine metabolism protein LicD